MLRLTLSAGYPTFTSGHRSKGGKTLWVHRVVLGAFAGPCPDGMQGCHNDGDRQNNRLSNLRYGTPTENQGDRVEHGTHGRGERSATAKLCEAQVLDIHRRAPTETHSALAAEFGVARTTITAINQGATWGWLTLR